MLKKTIKSVDYNGVSRTEDHYFNLDESELMDWEMSKNGGMSEIVKRIIDAKDNAALYSLFKDIVKRSYGIKSPDGYTFDKSDEIFAKFYHTRAYSVLLMELCTDAEAAAAFVNGIIPADMAKRLEEKRAAGEVILPFTN